MDESTLKSICQKTGWNLTWHEDYFSQERYADEIFHDLIAEAGFGFALDWKFIAADVLDGIKQSIPINVTVTKEVFTVSTLKPFNQSKERYRTVTLKRGDEEKVISYEIDEPGYLANEILQFAGINDKEIIDINPPGEDTYYFALLNKGLSREDLEPYDYNKSPTESSSKILTQAAKPAQSKYFYVPVFTTSISDSGNDNSASTINLLTFRQAENYQADYYASRVLPGQTLGDAVRQDLSADFKYSGHIKISDYRLLDVAADKHGNQLPRLMVNVEVEPFQSEGLTVLDTTVQWHTFPLDTMERNFGLGFDLHDEVVDEGRPKEVGQSLAPASIENFHPDENQSITELWKIFTDWLREAVPSEYEKLNPPATFKDFENFARVTGYELPENVAQLYRINDGGITEHPEMNGILNLEFLPIDTVISEWKAYREVDQGIYLDGKYPTYPNKAIKNTYANPKWIPIARDGSGNNIGIDLDPGETGTVGQVINFGSDEYEKFVIADSLEGFFKLILQQIANGNAKVSNDPQGGWCISNADFHLTDEFRKIIIPRGYMESHRQNEQVRHAENIGMFYYDKYENGNVSQSFSVVIERLGDEIAVESGNPELKKQIKAAIRQIAPNLDNDAYRMQLRNQLPEEVYGLRLRQ